MKVLVDIPDNEALFGLKVLDSLSFIRKTTPFTESAEKLLHDLQESAKEVRLHKQGKVTLKSAKELLHEL
ncbi:MAG: hypothetical protein JNJ85_09570 [Candidatus Kapabacteria bacterium]|nr:hypothetical protein [Candidatus Kapabacteria bacterium]